MNRSRRVRSPPFGYDPRVMGRADARPPPDYDDSYTPTTPFEPTQSAPAFVEPHSQYPVGYRENRLPSTYRATLREPCVVTTGSPPYKILCITNINHKVSDGPVKDALTSDFSRFGDISVSICHDSGERLAYIYFRSYEEAREARHAKARTLLFDRPIEIEPIYEPRSSPVDSPPQTSYPRRRSITPTDYYGINGPPPSARRRPPPPPPHNPHHRGLSPPNYTHTSRYPTGPVPSPLQPAPMPYGRYYLPLSHLPTASPYSSPPHEQYRSYHPHTQSHMNHFQPGHSYHPSYVPPSLLRDRERAINEGHLPRSPRHETYYPIDHRGYPSVPSQHSSSRASSSLHSSSIHHQHPNLPPNIHHQSSSSSNRRSPPPPPPPHHLDHPRYVNRDFRREKFSNENYNIEPEEGRPSRVLFVTNIDPIKSETDLKDVFETFGVIEYVEIKKISSEISSALIKFSSMDCAYKAKTATNGKYLGSLKCRITYGKVSASRRLWIGGLGSSTTVACLQDEFGKFGNIISLDYTSGRPYAYIEYELANQAQFAAHHLRGTFVADAERRIRIEFVDSVERCDRVSKLDSSLQESDMSSRSRITNESSNINEHHDATARLNSRKRSITPTDLNTKRALQAPGVSLNADKCAPEHKVDMATTKVSARTSSNSPVEDRSTTLDKNELNNNQETVRQGGDVNKTDNIDSITMSSTALGLDKLVRSKSIRDIVDCCSISWFGQLVLRNFNFPSKMFMCSGEKTTIEKYITRLNGENGDQCPILRITQRWRLHPQPKLEEVKRRMQSGNLGMLIITSTPDQSPTLSSPICKTPHSSTNQAPKQNGDKDEETPVDEKIDASSESSMTQSRPLKNLISYLEQKDAAGVISLNALDRDQTDGFKLLYAFPPGEFALNLLKRQAPNLTQESTKEEFLLGVIVGSSETKI